MKTLLVTLLLTATALATEVSVITSVHNNQDVVVIRILAADGNGSVSDLVISCNVDQNNCYQAVAYEKGTMVTARNLYRGRNIAIRWDNGTVGEYVLRESR